MNDNIHLVIPDNWSDEQALTIFDFLDKLRDKVWFEYQEGIIRQLRMETGGSELELDMKISELPEFDDDLDF